MKAVIVFVFTGGATSMFVTGCSNAEFMKVCHRMYRMILPMTVATDYKKIVRDIFLHPPAKLITFMFKPCIAMVVIFLFAIRAHEWGRTDQDLPGSSTFFYRFFEPCFLC